MARKALPSLSFSFAHSSTLPSTENRGKSRVCSKKACIPRACVRGNKESCFAYRWNASANRATKHCVPPWILCKRFSMQKWNLSLCLVYSSLEAQKQREKFLLIFFRRRNFSLRHFILSVRTLKLKMHFVYRLLVKIRVTIRFTESSALYQCTLRYICFSFLGTSINLAIRLLSRNVIFSRKMRERKNIKTLLLI